MSTDELVSIKAHPKALEVIRDCLAQAEAIENAWPADTDYGRKAYKSLAQVLGKFFYGQGFGPEEIYRDGDLTLITQTKSGFVFGTVFHRTHRPDPPQDGDLQNWISAPMLGRYCGHITENSRCLQPIVNGKPTCEGHLTLPIVMPVPGEWSNHS